MIRIKTKQELELIRQGGRKLARILDELMAMVQPGVNTAELEKYALKRMEEEGGLPAFKDYKMPDGKLFPSALITCLNEEVVHAPAVPGRVLRAGDIFTVDVGFIYPYPNNTALQNPHSECRGYYTDMCKTKAVGEIDKRTKELIEATKQSLYAGIKQVKPGNTLNDIGAAIQDIVEGHGFSIVRDLVGHGVGHELHEEPQVPHYRIKNYDLANAELKSGMVIAIEPMVNMGGWQVKAGPDGFTYVTADNSLSAHYEHTVAVTEEGFRIMTLL